MYKKNILHTKYRISRLMRYKHWIKLFADLPNKINENKAKANCKNA